MKAPSYAEGVLAGDRRSVARALTLVESRRPEDSLAAGELLARLWPASGRADRIAVSGPPGAGKSCFIEAIGLEAVEQGRKVAVLAIDPSSPRSGGSLMGDKTRMPRLSQSASALIRPSPAGDSVGGVAKRTREAITVMEAAGFDLVLIETVGVGQSEVAASQLSDLLLLLVLPGSGDGLQGIKRGVTELSDLFVVHKIDVQAEEAQRTARELEGALALLRPSQPPWKPRVLLASSVSGEGIQSVWEAISAHREATLPGREARRRAQQLYWFEQRLREQLWEEFTQRTEVKARMPELASAVRSGRISADQAVSQLLGECRGNKCL